jgi:thiol-disulfide isomerase/thioredoxin
MGYPRKSPNLLNPCFLLAFVRELKMKQALCLAILALVFGGSPRAQENVTLTGQIVCSECWFEADRKTTPYGTEEDIACALRCAKTGIPMALAVLDDKGEATLYLLEKGKYTPAGGDWVKMTGERVEVTGLARRGDKKPSLAVDTLKVLTKTPPPPVSGDGELALTDLAGAAQSLKDWRGRIVVLNYWATWCGPCVKEMPDLVALQNEYAPFGVQVIGASADDAADKAKVLQFARKAKLNFPIWLGASIADMQHMGLGQELPATAIVGRDGKIVYRVKGVFKAKELRQQLDKLLEEKTIAQAEKPQHSSAVPA